MISSGGEKGREQVHEQTQTKSQSEAQFEGLLCQHWDRLCRVLFQMTGDTAEAEDLALETFWRFWQNPPQKMEAIGGWLYRVATNLGYNALRARRRRSGYENQAVGEEWEPLDASNPLFDVERQEQRELVRRVLEQLPPRSSKILILRHSGLSYQEIAAAVGVAPGSIGTLLSRAEQEFENLYRLAGGEPYAPDR